MQQAPPMVPHAPASQPPPMHVPAASPQLSPSATQVPATQQALPSHACPGQQSWPGAPQPVHVPALPPPPAPTQVRPPVQ